ncbi:hypothetical protein ACOME3_009693 [Neoechinorhynchus agilis]
MTEAFTCSTGAYGTGNGETSAALFMLTTPRHVSNTTALTAHRVRPVLLPCHLSQRRPQTATFVSAFNSPLKEQYEWTFLSPNAVNAVNPASPPNQQFPAQLQPPIQPPPIAHPYIVLINAHTYALNKIIYQSPNSLVFKAQCLETGRRVAVKEQTITPYNGNLNSFNNEIQLLKYLHMRRAKSECKLTQNKTYSVMELGISLRKIMGTGPVSEPTRKKLWKAMVEAVESLHRNRVIHTDIKPDNFIYTSDGDLKLIDFGFSLVIPKGVNGVKYKSRGTRNYLSPEVAGNMADCVYTRKVDVWGLGCILYEMAYGETPFRYIECTEPKLSAISNPLFPISFPPLNDKSLHDLLKTCFNRNPLRRPSISDLKSHAYYYISDQ